LSCTRVSYRRTATNLYHLLQHKLIRERQINLEISFVHIQSRARDLCVSRLFTGGGLSTSEGTVNV